MNLPMFTADFSLYSTTSRFHLDGRANLASDRTKVNPQLWAGCLCTSLCFAYPFLYCCEWQCCVCRGTDCTCS
jgi:hypothetical protein